MPSTTMPVLAANLSRRLCLIALACAGLGVRTPRAQTPPIKLVMRNKQWDPTELTVPANEKFELHITNADAVAIEFESHDMRREKVIAPGETVVVFIGPLRPGTYNFLNDFNKAARGRIIAK